MEAGTYSNLAHAWRSQCYTTSAERHPGDLHNTLCWSSGGFNHVRSLLGFSRELITFELFILQFRIEVRRVTIVRSERRWRQGLPQTTTSRHVSSSSKSAELNDDTASYSSRTDPILIPLVIVR